jgi:membrane fusion protein (multidrug efflux system)
VNAKNVVEPRPVQVGDWQGDDWIILDGLQEGDQVIVDGMVKARPGSPVRIAQPAPPTQPGLPSGAPPAKPAEDKTAATGTVKPAN